MGERFRWAVGVLEAAGDDCALRYLRPGLDFERWNQGRAFQEIESLGYQGYPAFSLTRERHTSGVLSALMRRLPPRTRPDFAEYKRQFRLPDHLAVTDFGLLGITEAKLPSDGFSVVDPFDAGTVNCDLLLEVAGYRYYAQKIRLGEGDPVGFDAEPQNPRDPNAVMVRSSGQLVGYINRLQAGAFRCWLAGREVSGVIERLNGQAGKPRAFVFVRVRPARGRAAA